MISTKRKGECRLCFQKKAIYFFDYAIENEPIVLTKICGSCLRELKRILKPKKPIGVKQHVEE